VQCLCVVKECNKKQVVSPVLAVTRWVHEDSSELKQTDVKTVTH
jgi:hypothetical protein